MDKRTADALEASIVHWEENLAAEQPTRVSIGPRACALCRLFWEWLDCRGCPVSARTGRTQCYATPYDDVITALRVWEFLPDDAAAKAAWRTAARAQLDFLISLREPAEATAS
jgi:hypothetical protein